MSKDFKILFLGDIVGRPGRNAVREFLDEVVSKYDFNKKNYSIKSEKNLLLRRFFSKSGKNRQMDNLQTLFPIIYLNKARRRKSQKLFSVRKGSVIL